MKVVICSFAIAVGFSSFASAGTGKAYKMDCLVYGAGASVSTTVAPKSGDSISIYKTGNLEYFAGATESVNPPSTDVSVQFYLTIEKDGETLAQSISEYNVPKESFVVLRSLPGIPQMSCIPAK